jgi:hypothetical protein
LIVGLTAPNVEETVPIEITCTVWVDVVVVKLVVTDQVAVIVLNVLLIVLITLVEVPTWSITSNEYASPIIPVIVPVIVCVELPLTSVAYTVVVPPAAGIVIIAFGNALTLIVVDVVPAKFMVFDTPPYSVITLLRVR